MQKHCNRSGILSYKAGSEQNVLMIFKFSGLTTSGYSLCKNRLTCFKNEVSSDISCFMSIMYWAADQKFLSSNTLVTKTSSACVLARELRSAKLVSVRTCLVNIFFFMDSVTSNELAPDLTIVTYFYQSYPPLFVINIIGIYNLYYKAWPHLVLVLSSHIFANYDW